MNCQGITNRHNHKERKLGTLISILTIIILIIFLNSTDQYSKEDKSNIDFINKNPKISWGWATLDLTNPIEVNNTLFPHNIEIFVKGRLYNKINGTGKAGRDVILVVDGVQDPRYTNTTDNDGKFQINYTVDPSLNVFSKHKIEVLVTNIPPGGEVEYRHHYIIEVNATSYFDVDSYNLNNPQFAGGSYKIPGFLRYDNSSGIKNVTINYYWYNESSEKWPMNTFKTNIIDGSLKKIALPLDDNYSKTIHLNLTYAGNIPHINGTQKLLSVQLYRNITCVWNTVGSATEGNTITIRGQLFARNNSNLKINFTEIELNIINGSLIGNTTTDANGNFTYSYQIPIGIIGNRSIEVRLLNFLNVFSNTTHLISIASAPLAPITPSGSIGDGDEDTPPPFQNFFMIFIPIIIGIAAALIIFAYFHLRKQKEEALIVKLPLEDRIRNLKILKDTGRLEEALSYLFQSIYIELINAKYGRKKNENETIRDFAIISVKELKLNPASIYPFIQNVEKIIYDKPFIIKEQDFYASVELFSPIYFELTGYQFILNF
ncbi:MAG: hypothetical protein ACFE8A_11890 [Candidatus Hodarchaeota archaeon]